MQLTGFNQKTILAIRVFVGGPFGEASVCDVRNVRGLG